MAKEKQHPCRLCKELELPKEERLCMELVLPKEEGKEMVNIYKSWH
jgi:hypothetical protein